MLVNNILSTDPRRRVSTSVNPIAWVGSRTWWWLFDTENTYMHKALLASLSYGYALPIISWPAGDGLVGPEDEDGSGSLDIDGFDGSLTGGRRVWGGSCNLLLISDHHRLHDLFQYIITWVMVDDGTDAAGAVVVKRTWMDWIIFYYFFYWLEEPG